MSLDICMLKTWIYPVFGLTCILLSTQKVTETTIRGCREARQQSTGESCCVTHRLKLITQADYNNCIYGHFVHPYYSPPLKCYSLELSSVNKTHVSIRRMRFITLLYNSLQPSQTLLTPTLTEVSVRDTRMQVLYIPPLMSAVLEGEQLFTQENCS